jgi:glycosyltransferase involved in cell wall biosynthesis
MTSHTVSAAQGRITVIISAKDAAATIKPAIASVLRSLPADGRVIVRSDGSTDGTTDVARTVADRRMTVLPDDEWLGIPGSLNRLLEHVTTPLVSRMDADDISLPGRFEAQARRIDAGLDFTFTTSVAWREGTLSVRPQKPYPIGAASAPFLLLLTNPFIQSTMLARTDAIRALGGYRHVASEDFDLFLRAAAQGYTLERRILPRMIYRRSATQITAQSSWWKAQHENTLVEEAFGELSTGLLGFVPRWFRWRRAGFPLDAVPGGVLDDIERFREAASSLRTPERFPVNRRLSSMASRAARAVPPTSASAL